MNRARLNSGASADSDPRRFALWAPELRWFDMGDFDIDIVQVLATSVGPFPKLIHLRLDGWSAEATVPVDSWFANILKRFECRQIQQLQLNCEWVDEYESLLGEQTLRAIFELQASSLTHLLIDCAADGHIVKQALLECIVSASDRFVTFNTARARGPPLLFAPAAEARRYVPNPAYITNFPIYDSNWFLFGREAERFPFAKQTWASGNRIYLPPFLYHKMNSWFGF